MSYRRQLRCVRYDYLMTNVGCCGLFISLFMLQALINILFVPVRKSALGEWISFSHFLKLCALVLQHHNCIFTNPEGVVVEMSHEWVLLQYTAHRPLVWTHRVSTTQLEWLSTHSALVLLSHLCTATGQKLCLMYFQNFAVWSQSYKSFMHYQ